jgi:hypothetical protein
MFSGLYLSNAFVSIKDPSNPIRGLIGVTRVAAIDIRSTEVWYQVKVTWVLTENRLCDNHSRNEFSFGHRKTMPRANITRSCKAMFLDSSVADLDGWSL